MKQLTAFAAALAITAAVGISILLLGANALFNQNTVAAKDSPGSVTSVQGTSLSGAAAASQVDQATLNQYQAQLADVQQQLTDATDQIQQYQQLLRVLARQGLINISADGTIYIPRFQGNDSP